MDLMVWKACFLSSMEVICMYDRIRSKFDIFSIMLVSFGLKLTFVLLAEAKVKY